MHQYHIATMTSRMKVSKAQHEGILNLVRALTDALETGRTEDVASLLDVLIGMRESRLFQELGRLTRQLHETLSHFEQDDRLAQLAGKQIPDARERLDYAITKTEEAAHCTLTAVENAVPIGQGLAQRARALKEPWRRLQRERLAVEDFRAPLRELLEFFDIVERDAIQINTYLSEVLMAQEFQDLTGQMIHHVMEVVQEVENHLVSFIRARGHLVSPDTVGQELDNARPQGPAVKTKGVQEVVSGQDEVDDLLSSLGF